MDNQCKVITCTGFYGTGSSAVTDIFSDCDNVCCKGDYEVRILHDPNGVSDLEYHLIENPNRHNTSNAIKLFKKQVDFLSGIWSGKTCERYFNGTYKKLSYEYIRKITEFTYYGKWHGDLLLRGKYYSFVSRCYNKLFSLPKKILHMKHEIGHDLLPKKETAYAGIMDQERFLSATRWYVKELLSCLNQEGFDYIMVDQLVPPTNIKRYGRYVENLKTVIVERDPRDLYLSEKYVWKGTVIPYYDVAIFCKWYKWTRKQCCFSETEDNVLQVQFEDLIYNSETLIKRLLDFAGIHDSHYTMKHFNPEVSRKNTRLWMKYREEETAIAVIEHELKEYLYPYDNV